MMTKFSHLLPHHPASEQAMLAMISSLASFRIHICFWVCVLLVSHHSAFAELTTEQTQFFENKIRPLLVEHCYECHSSDSDEPEGGLALDSQAGWMTGGDTGAAVVPGDVEKSLLIEAVDYNNVDLQMPPEGKLAPEEVELLKKWVALGAPDPRLATSSKDEERKVFDLQKRRNEHWCWQPIADESPPAVQSAWPRKDLDKFILRKLQSQGITPANKTDKRTFLRRATFATIGLPPTLEEIEAYLNDASETATEKVVNRLLDSPHFGENWAQHWLDLMRFAETRGHEQDFAIPEAYRYRDYVIQAFNDDVSYDQFLLEHIAGDLLEKPRLHPQNRSNQSIQGTGFWHLHDATHSPVDIRGDEALRMQNQIDVFSRTFLGLSLGCARCHDHKFDAISTRDYYAMYGYLQSTGYHLANVADPERQAEVAQQLEQLHEQHEATVQELYGKRVKKQTNRLFVYLEHATQFKTDVASQKEMPQSMKETAAQYDLDANVLWNVVRHLHQNVSIDSPLRPWATLATKPASQISRICSDLHRQRQKAHNDNNSWENLTVTVSKKVGERDYRSESRKWSEQDLIEDFADRNPMWLTAGHRFGNAPLPMGKPILSRDPLRPVTWFTDSPSAGIANSSKLSGMYRTPTFEVTADQIWYRVRGNGNIFLAVDSHRVVAGPLHGRVKKKVKQQKDWVWISQNVRDYMGHRVHAEFTGDPGFAVDQIVFAARRPPTPIMAGADLRQVESMASLTEATKLLFAQAVAGLKGDKVSPHDARLLSWFATNHDLFEQMDDQLSTSVRAFAKQAEQIESRLPPKIIALTVMDGTGEDEPVHVRGNHKNRTEDPVPRGWLEALGDVEAAPPKYRSGRLRLAEKLVRPDNPLVARVYVNRIWHHLFGRGIVESVDDFGVMGKKPSHPDLLDYLAAQFVRNGWSTKWLIREILLSQTYQMSSKPSETAEQLDPTNVLLHRMPVRRLTGEVIRDHMLSVSGRLNRKLFGKSIRVHITPFMRGNRTPGHSGPVDGDGRRSIYTEVRRNHLPAFLAAFDKPPPFMAIGKRTVSNSPTQSLILLNDPLVHDQAMLWAKKLLDKEMNEENRVATAFEQAFARKPTEIEMSAAIGFLENQQAAYTEKNPRLLVWRDLCHTLFNVKEFIHVN